MTESASIPVWEEGRIKTPTLIQMEAVECGAASLGIVLSYFKRFEPLETLREACGISRDGSKASNILKAGRAYGMECKGFREDLADLGKHPLPLIVFWNYNHFLVLEGTDAKKGTYFLNDPAKGPRKVTAKEFEHAYTGIVLTAQPGPEFQTGGEKPSIVKSLQNRMQTCRDALTYAALTALFLVIPGIVVPSLSQIYLDEILVEGMGDWIRPVLLALILVSLVQAGLTFMQKYYLLRMQTKLAISGATKFLRHIFRLPVSFFFQRYAGDVAGRMALNDKIASTLADQVAVNVINGVMILFYLVVMIQYDWVLSLIGACMAALNLAALQYVARRRKDLNQRMQMEYGKLMGQAMTGLQLIETLKASGAETDFFSSWAGYQAKTINSQQEYAVTNQYLSAVPPLLTSLNTAAILGVGSFRIIEGDMTIGTLVAFQALMGMFLKPVNQLVALGSSLQDTWSDINRLDDVLRHKEDPVVSDMSRLEPVPDDQELRLTGKLEIQNVTFGYSPLEPPLIEDFSLALHPGERVALVGSSGSGKSTVAKLVSGLYTPWEGQVLFDGKTINELRRDTVVRSMSMVDQEIFLFEGSVRDNLTMWDTSVPSERLLQAAGDACILDDILLRSGGMDGDVDEGGGNFSGGQRQRLEIARALAVDPSILILDEATSALDPQTEMLVDQSVRQRGCTCIIIAHRLSTIRDADEIIVLDKGKVVQRGTHDELKVEEGLYADLIAAQ